MRHRNEMATLGATNADALCHLGREQLGVVTSHEWISITEPAVDGHGDLVEDESPVVDVSPHFGREGAHRDGEGLRGNGVSHDRRLPGRGAHLHPTRECLELAERRRAFPRALRVSGPLGLDLLRTTISTTSA